jgi:hypothetical protein
MDYLTICQRVNDAVGFQSSITSVDAVGYQATLTQAVKDAYDDVQRYRTDWEFSKRHRSVNVSELSSSYTLTELWSGDTVDLSQWQYINYDYKRIPQMDYDSFVLQDFTTYGASEPRFFAIEPWTKSLLIAPVDQVYTLDVHYLVTLHKLVLNTDVPNVPERHHQLIVYKAIMKLATFVGNITLYDTYALQTAIELGQLMREENPAKAVTKRPIA